MEEQVIEWVQIHSKKKINERDLASMNPTELKGILDICYKKVGKKRFTIE